MSLLNLNDNINNINKDVILDILLKCHSQRFSGNLTKIGNVYVNNYLDISDEEWEDVVKNPNNYHVYFKRSSGEINYNIVHTHYIFCICTDLYNMWYGGFFTMKHYILDYEQLIK